MEGQAFGFGSRSPGVDVSDRRPQGNVRGGVGGTDRMQTCRLCREP